MAQFAGRVCGLFFATILALSAGAAAAKPPQSSSGATPFVFQELQHDYFSAVDYESGTPVCDPTSPNSTGTCDPTQDVYNPAVPGDPVLPASVSPPAPCAWDSDDALSIAGTGDLAAGASASYTFCVIHDSFDHPEYSSHPTAFRVDSPSPSLLLRISYDYDPSYTVTSGPPTRLPDGTYEYRLCYQVRVGVVGQVFPVIDYSNGGTGVRVQTTVTLTNLSGKTVRKSEAHVTNGFYNNPYLLWWDNGC